MDELDRQYLKILVSIAKDKNLFKLARYIERYDKVEEIKETVKEEVKEDVKEIKPIIKPKYNITHLPEAVCDGCEG